MENSKLATSMCILLIVLSTAGPVHALSAGQQVRSDITVNVQERIENRKEMREEIRENVASRVGAIKKFFTSRAVIKQGKITAKGTSSLTVEENSRTYTVTIDDKTRLRRRFFGASSFDEVLIGHTVNVIGKFTDENKTAIQALLVRDLSIQKRFGVFVGNVTAVSGNEITLASVHRGAQHVTVSSSTKFINRTEESIVQADITVGHRIRVKGMWDRTNNTITEVMHVKDYSLPPRITPTPKSKIQ